jgi:hypothetical protein
VVDRPLTHTGRISGLRAGVPLRNKLNKDNLNLAEILEFNPDEGLIRFAGQRALLLDAVAMGFLRKYHTENFGLTASRAVFTHFGFAHGWRMA